MTSGTDETWPEVVPHPVPVTCLGHTGTKSFGFFYSSLFHLWFHVVRSYLWVFCYSLMSVWSVLMFLICIKSLSRFSLIIYLRTVSASIVHLLRLLFTCNEENSLLEIFVTLRFFLDLMNSSCSYMSCNYYLLLLFYSCRSSHSSCHTQRRGCSWGIVWLGLTPSISLTRT